MIPVRKYKRKSIVKSSPCVANEASEGLTVSTFRLHHIKQLLALLKHHLLQHNYTPAGQIMQTLVHASDLVPDTCRNVGLAVLQQGSNTYAECLQYYKQLLSKKNAKHREEILLEMTFYMIFSEHLQDAQETMKSYLQVDPFKSNLLLQGYAGLYCYVLWKEKLESEVFQSGSQGSADSYAREALSHWRFLIGQPGCWDPFVLRHAELGSSGMSFTRVRLETLRRILVKKSMGSTSSYMIHVHFDEADKALDVLLQYQQNNPTNMNAYRYLIEHNHLHKKDDVLAEQLLRGLVQLDPSCPEVLQLTELLLAKDSPNYSEIHELLSRFMDYPHNSGEIKALKLLTIVLKNTE